MYMVIALKPGRRLLEGIALKPGLWMPLLECDRGSVVLDRPNLTEGLFRCATLRGRDRRIVLICGPC